MSRELGVFKDNPLKKEFARRLEVAGQTFLTYIMVPFSILEEADLDQTEQV